MWSFRFNYSHKGSSSSINIAADGPAQEHRLPLRETWPIPCWRLGQAASLLNTGNQNTALISCQCLAEVGPPTTLLPAPCFAVTWAQTHQVLMYLRAFALAVLASRSALSPDVLLRGQLLRQDTLTAFGLPCFHLICLFAFLSIFYLWD
jgi:hypothetical protein